MLLTSTATGLLVQLMMTSSNWNILCITDHLCGEFTGHRWIPLTKASDAELFDLCLNTRLSKQTWVWWFETPSRPLWRHYDAFVQTNSKNDITVLHLALCGNPSGTHGFLSVPVMQKVFPWHNLFMGKWMAWHHEAFEHENTRSQSKINPGAYLAVYSALLHYHWVSYFRGWPCFRWTNGRWYQHRHMGPISQSFLWAYMYIL